MKVNRNHGEVIKMGRDVNRPNSGYHTGVNKLLKSTVKQTLVLISRRPYHLRITNEGVDITPALTPDNHERRFASEPNYVLISVKITFTYVHSEMFRLTYTKYIFDQS